MNRKFGIGFFVGLLLFIGINLITAHLSSDCGLPAVFGAGSCADAISRVGWPLQFHEQGGFAYRSNFNPPFLLIDTVIGIGLASLCGWIYARSKKTLSK